MIQSSDTSPALHASVLLRLTSGFFDQLLIAFFSLLHRFHATILVIRLIRVLIIDHPEEWQCMLSCAGHIVLNLLRVEGK